MVIACPSGTRVLDGVWVQAVIQCVLEPQRVADEIRRVLKPDGVVFSTCPFMQQVVEGAYDYTRFTLSGHRWLYRGFEQIDAGLTKGSGAVLVWSIRYFIRSLGLGRKPSYILSLPFFWLRFFGNAKYNNLTSDAASGTYFFGAKSGKTLSPKEIVAYYDSQNRKR